MKHVCRALLVFVFLFSVALPTSAETERTWQDERIYFIMVDRFNNGNPKNDYEVDVHDPKAYHGGDLQGIIDKLDYIKQMGFTAIWLTPIFANEKGGYHGYWIEDFYKVEEHFGTLDDFKRLVKEAHKRDMKVILDFVVNHTGYNHPWLNDPAKKDWFHEKKDIFNWANQQEVENGWLFGLPDLAQENPEVKAYLFDVAKWWIQETDIDGYRLDTVKHVPKWFWDEFSKEVKSVKQDFFLLGEVWHDDPRYVAEYGKHGIDALIDFPFYKEASTIFSNVDQSLEPIYNVWKRNEAFYDRPYLLGTFLDNHDTVRFTRLALQNRINPVTRLKLGLTYLFSAPGIPIMYYGTEIALDGGEDPDNRRLMNFRTDKELVDYVTKLGELREKLPSLRRGDFELLYEKDGMALFKRTYKNETAVIAINNTSKTQKVTLTNELEQGKELRGLLAGDLVRSKDGKYDIILDRETAEIYVLAPKTGLNIPFIAALVAVYTAFGLFLYFARKRKA
ncbi:alpha-amylase [Anoxybacillus mongoliensis]|uniref:alpha-amylase n=1 Tax=Anoxybacillus mongoliensis TaxID=452565 RepID=A0A7W8JCS1_9BACL|nr:alpha-amylase family glycosyl hydrolase [Anoxybacillus mongoliensis]MBB5354325.1 alpha-amylase [Anoxybacillus mongoliensis]MCX8000974.1 alpha-amylase family glycosyl hydrolase [Anoxybacillus mongoliensis]